MAYGFNDNTYITKRTVEIRDVFKKENIRATSGSYLGSGLVNAIIVDEDDREATYGLEGQPYIDLMVSLGYVELYTF